MAEWPKAHAWKVCIRQRIEGSNPSLSAIFKKKFFSQNKTENYLRYILSPVEQKNDVWSYQLSVKHAAPHK